MNTMATWRWTSAWEKEPLASQPFEEKNLTSMSSEGHGDGGTRQESTSEDGAKNDQDWQTRTERIQLAGQTAAGRSEAVQRREGTKQW